MSDQHPQGIFVPEARPGHQAETVDVRRLLAWAGILMAGVVAACVAVALLFGSFQRAAVKEDRRAVVSPLAGQRGQPPGPLLQWSPRMDMDVMRVEQGDVLGHEGWVDQGAGVAHIPIEQAMLEIAAGRRPQAIGVDAGTQPAAAGRAINSGPPQTDERPSLPTGVQAQPHAPRAGEKDPR